MKLLKLWHNYRALEFAAINPGFWGQKYRLAYGLGFPTGYLVMLIFHISLFTGVRASTIYKLTK